MIAVSIETAIILYWSEPTFNACKTRYSPTAIYISTLIILIYIILSFSWARTY